MGAVALTMTRANPDSIVCRRSSRQGRIPLSPLNFHLDPPPGSGAFAFRISRVECVSLGKNQNPKTSFTNGAACGEEILWTLSSATPGRVFSNLVLQEINP